MHSVTGDFIYTQVKMFWSDFGHEYCDIKCLYYPLPAAAARCSQQLPQTKHSI